MKQSEAKNLYDALKEEGNLKSSYGKKMTGDWAKDSAEFTKQFEENEKIFNLDTIEVDEDEDLDSEWNDEY